MPVHGRLFELAYGECFGLSCTSTAMETHPEIDRDPLCQVPLDEQNPLVVDGEGKEQQIRVPAGQTIKELGIVMSKPSAGLPRPASIFHRATIHVAFHFEERAAGAEVAAIPNF